LEVTWKVGDWSARRLALVIVGVTAKFFRVMLRIVSIVSRALTISQNRTPLLRRQTTGNSLNQLLFLRGKGVDTGSL
jgi:hypothetical protein